MTKRADAPPSDPELASDGRAKAQRKSPLRVVLIDPNPVTRELNEVFVRGEGCLVSSVVAADELPGDDDAQLLLVSADQTVACVEATLRRLARVLPEAAVALVGAQRTSSRWVDFGARDTFLIPADYGRLREMIQSLEQELSHRRRAARPPLSKRGFNPKR